MGLPELREKIKAKLLSDCDNTEVPWKLRHVQGCNAQLSTIGSWPHKLFGNMKLHKRCNIYNIFLIILANIFNSLAFIYLLEHWATSTFFDMGHIIVTLLMNSIYMTRLVQFRSAKIQKVIREYLYKFHLFYFKEKSAIHDQVYREIHVYSGILTLYVLFELQIGVALFIFKPLYNNYRLGLFSDNPTPNATFEHSVYFYCKDDYFYKDIKGYWILFAINVPNSYNVCTGVLGCDLLLLLIVLQINGHLKIMKHNLMSFPEPEHGLMYSDEENVRVSGLLKDIIVHHNLIIEFVNQCADSFKEHLLIFLFFSQFMACFLLLELSALTVDALYMYAPLATALWLQLTVLSFMCEAVNTRSDELKHAVYSTPWECMNKKNRMTVLLVLFKTQDAISIKAGGVIVVGVQTMATLFKTAVSYFMMMKTMAAEK